MAEEEGWGWPPSPSGSPMYLTKDDHWTHFDNSVNAVSFGFVATAILISMFLIMAIFERFLGPPSPPDLTPSGHRRHAEIESQLGYNPKLVYPTPKALTTNVNDVLHGILLVWRQAANPEKIFVSTNAREFSVLMPGNDMPTFIAHPAPVPCQPERNPWPSHQQSPLPCVMSSNSNVSS
ncbi:hypothetical protein RND71_033453 [Anisodus tanguticus]|uniref:Uncharacterized protein n=1 Tax=Anisodus tanguticus TaxID=243964 RepID=A0AAE1R7Q0_9SOLA|nr:hypothetical protein RND71_033453 [Anisodus tanguticus]